MDFDEHAYASTSTYASEIWSSFCILCNKTQTRQLRAVEKPFAFCGPSKQALELIENVLGVSLQEIVHLKPKVCETCLRTLTRVSRMKETFESNKKKFLENNPETLKFSSGESDSDTSLKLSGSKNKPKRKRGNRKLKLSNPTSRQKASASKDNGDHDYALTEPKEAKPLKREAKTGDFNYYLRGQGQQGILCVEPIDSQREHGYAMVSPLEELAKQVVSSSCTLSLLGSIGDDRRNQLCDVAIKKSSIANLLSGVSPALVANVIFDNKDILDQVQRRQLIALSMTCDKLCTHSQGPGPSVLRMVKSLDKMTEEIFWQVILEMKRSLPFLLEVFLVVCRPMHSSDSKCLFTVASMYGMAMYMRNSQLSAIQRLHTAMFLKHAGSAELLSHLNKNSITLCKSSIRPHMMRNLAKTVDQSNDRKQKTSDKRTKSV